MVSIGFKESDPPPSYHLAFTSRVIRRIINEDSVGEVRGGCLAVVRRYEFGSDVPCAGAVLTAVFSDASVGTSLGTEWEQ